MPGAVVPFSSTSPSSTSPVPTLRLVWTVLLVGTVSAAAQGPLQDRLRGEDEDSLAAAARSEGDPLVGAAVFLRPALACVKCHQPTSAAAQVGPSLTGPREGADDRFLVRSVLHPSADIRKGHETVRILTADGEVVTGVVTSEDADALVVAEPSQPGTVRRIAKDQVEQRAVDPKSSMPEGLTNLLADRDEFLDLIAYLAALRDGGVAAARRLQPPPHLLDVRTPAEYEKQVDHAGLIAALDAAAVDRGRELYGLHCKSCHGSPDQEGFLPDSRKFWQDRFKAGADPYSIYTTLTNGLGMMAAQHQLVPRQKYDLAQFLRKAYVEPANPSQYAPVDEAYLAALPPGTTFGPEPPNGTPYTRMDYGRSLSGTYHLDAAGDDYSYKGMAVRLDPGAGGVAAGESWMLFDEDTLRVAAAWHRPEGERSDRRFIDWHGVQFTGEHSANPQPVGRVVFANPEDPGWADPATGSFASRRFVGPDGRRYGPLPRDWGRFRGRYVHGERTIVSYDIGHAAVLESFDQLSPDVPVRRFDVGPRDREMVLRVADYPAEQVALTEHGGGVVELGRTRDREELSRREPPRSYRVVRSAEPLDPANRDFSAHARIVTEGDGTVFASTRPERWTPNAVSLFVSRGRLVFDIAYAGVVKGRTRVADGRPHTVGVTYDHLSGEVTLYVDGVPDRRGTLRATSSLAGCEVRLGYTNSDYPGQSLLPGRIDDFTLYDRIVPSDQWNVFADAAGQAVPEVRLPAGARVFTTADAQDDLAVRTLPREGMDGSQPLFVSLTPEIDGATWELRGSRLCLRLPAGQERLRFGVAYARGVAGTPPELRTGGVPPDLLALTHGGPDRYPQAVQAGVRIDTADRAFLADTFELPEPNPWDSRIRLTGLDFLDADRVAVCTWDGDVWIVSGLADSLPEGRDAATVTWRRIATGLFQPLGLKVVGGRIHLTCRDQLCVLHDENGDGYTDFYQCLNGDHYVSRHFHEFAMGLQTDAAGNFLYAKAGRHNRPALHPHHGTLIRVSPDGETSEVVATGFRAPNGVCIGPDGSIIVTDQEGNWIPKNRINWITAGGHYGFDYAWHHAPSSSDADMELPLAFITNEFDRSPAEMLWIPEGRWGRLAGGLLNMSYGYGQLYLTPYELVEGQAQGGMVEIPLPRFPTGTQRGKFSPAPGGGLYLAGMYSWAGSQTKPGGLYRVRHDDRPVHLPTGLNATADGVRLVFSDPLDRTAATDPKSYGVRVWNLKRTKEYGSDHYDERDLAVTAAALSDDGRNVTLTVPDLKPTWGMEIVYDLLAADGTKVRSRIHNSIHKMPPADTPASD